MLNRALVFIKPHATVLKSVDFIENFLKKNGVSMLDKGRLTAEEIDRKGIIEKHYFAIANIAASRKPEELAVGEESKDLFKKSFGVEWDKALSDGLLFNGLDLQKRSGGLSGVELNQRLSKCKQAKLAPGFYAAEIDGVYGLNGFYPALREVFTTPGNEVIWYHVSFDPKELSWADFRGKVIGATDPAQAVEGSLRHELYSNYNELGIKNQPSMSENGVHASAGPLEGLRERMVWLGVDPKSDELGSALLEAGKPLESYLENIQVELGKESGPIFDLTEDQNTLEVLQLLT